MLPNELRPGMGPRPRNVSARLESGRQESNLWTPLRQSDRCSCHRVETPRKKWGRFAARWFCVVRSNQIEKTLGEVLAREPVLLSRKLAGRDSNPLDLSVVPCTPNRQPSVFRYAVLFVVMQKRDRRSCDQRVLRRSTTELRPCVSERKLGRWDSNPRHPAPEACTPNRQSIVCVGAISVSSSKSSASASTHCGCGPDRAGLVAAVVCR